MAEFSGCTTVHDIGGVIGASGFVGITVIDASQNLFAELSLEATFVVAGGLTILARVCACARDFVTDLVVVAAGATAEYGTFLTFSIDALAP